MKRVWLSLPMEYGYFREMIPGFLSYPCRRSGWVPRISEHLPAVLASVLRDPDNPAWTQYSAVVAPFSSPEICRLALESRQKVVNVSAAYDAAELPSVVADNGQVGEIAADHFLGLGFRRMVYVGGNAWFSRERLRGFSSRAQKAGATVALVREGSRIRIEKALGDLPDPPCAILAESDELALEIVYALEARGRHVPVEYAVMGVNHDEILTRAVGLSSVDPSPRRIGYEAAIMVDRLLHGEPLDSLRVVVPPAAVVPGRTTDTVALDDPQVAQAVVYIRSRSAELIQVPDVVDATGLSRRAIEIRFRRQMGRTILQEIHRVRMLEAARQLAHSDAQVADIARRTGYQHLPRFSRQFRKSFGCSPGLYRRNYRMV